MGYECPQCSKENRGGTFVMGHHYCPDCDIRYTDSGKVIGEGRVQMNLDEYQQEASKTAIFPDELPEFLSTGQVYTVLGQTGESGEIAEKLKKAIRENDEEYIEEMRAEVGDVLWYLSQVCEEFGWDMGEVAEDNIVKLQDRQERGKLTGEGDNR